MRDAARALFCLILAIPALAALAPGDHDLSLKHDGIDRSYIVHVPPGAATALPLVISMHGGGSDAAAQQGYSQMDRVADREHFLVLYPNGTGRGRMRVWN